MRKSEGSIRKLRNVSTSSVYALKKDVCSTFKEADVDCNQFELGYYEPGHGTKGKKRWLIDDEDLKDMKKAFQKKKEVLLWCYDPSIKQISRKRSRKDEPESSAPQAKSRSRFVSAYEKKMSKVEEIYESLQEKHGSKFKAEQLRAWANMVQMNKHTSLEEPPTGRFFKTQNESKTSESSKKITEVPATQTSTDPTVLSPAKRVTLRTQCIEQLERWHQLMEKGGISKEQYDGLQADILAEIKKY